MKVRGSTTDLLHVLQNGIDYEIKVSILPKPSRDSQDACHVITTRILTADTKLSTIYGNQRTEAFTSTSLRQDLEWRKEQMEIDNKTYWIYLKTNTNVSFINKITSKCLNKLKQKKSLNIAIKHSK